MSDCKPVHGEAILGAVAIVTAFVVLMLAAYSVTAAAGYIPLRMPFQNRVLLQVWFPQGWKFFTRSPREDVQFVFVRESTGAWKPLGYGVNSRPGNLFGINRKNRAQNVELGRLMQAIPKAAWLPTQGDAVEALEKSAVVLTIENETPQATIRGTIGIVKQAPVPWAWFARGTKAVMPSKVIKMEVK